MGLGRVELPTSRLSGVRSNHLSYRPRKRPKASCAWELSQPTQRRESSEPNHTGNRNCPLGGFELAATDRAAVYAYLYVGPRSTHARDGFCR